MACTWLPPNGPAAETAGPYNSVWGLEVEGKVMEDATEKVERQKE